MHWHAPAMRRKSQTPGMGVLLFAMACKSHFPSETIYGNVSSGGDVNRPITNWGHAMQYLPKKSFYPILIAAIFCLQGGHGWAENRLPANPVWEWKAENPADQHFDGNRVLNLPQVRQLYNASEPFMIEVRLRPTGASRLAGIVSDYSDSKGGGWYLSLGANAPFLNPKVVAIDETPYPDGYHSLDSGIPVQLGQWHDLLLYSDGRQVSLIIDGKPAGAMVLKDVMKRPSKGGFRIGSRGKDNFEGDIAHVRLYTEVPPLDSLIPGANYISNSSFEVGNDLSEALVWHRMTGSPTTVLSMEEGWVLDDTTASHGERSLRGEGGVPLVLTEEVWGGLPSASPWVFSVYMKADREGATCELGVGEYWRLEEETVSATVKLTTEWQRYSLVVDSIPNASRRGGLPVQGPVNFYIRPEAGAVVWVDAVQWEPGIRPLGYQETVEADQWGDAPALVFAEGAAAERLATGQSNRQFSVPLRVHVEGDGAGEAQPLVASVPFSSGQWNGQGAAVLKRADGRILPVQTEVLTHWPTDQSVQALAVYFVDTPHAGWNNYTLELGGVPVEDDISTKAQWQLVPPKQPGQLWSGITDVSGKSVIGAADIRAIGLDGTEYRSSWDRSAAKWAWERTGSLYSTVRATGLLVDQGGRSILAYTARIHLWRDLPGVRLEVAVINTRASDSIHLRTVYWQAEGLTGINEILTTSGVEAAAIAPVQATIFYRPENNTYALLVDSEKGVDELNERSPLALVAQSEAGGLLLHAPEAWQRHPSAIAFEPGMIRGYLWPEWPVRGLSLARGMALNREFWLRAVPSAKEALNAIAAWDQAPVGIATPEWWASTDVILPFAASDPAHLAFIEGQLGTEDLLGRVGPAAVEASRAYGVFDYGDNHGDGGWGNLESFNDWAAFLAGLRSGNEVALRSGFCGSRHYRDIDMKQTTGECYTHNLGHVLADTHFSHAWPEGVMVDYLLTGSRRSLEVILLHGEYLLAMDKNDPSLVAGTRNLGRYLTNLVNLYQLTGDKRYRDRFFEQVELSKQVLAADTKNPDRSIFSYMGHSQSRRLVPFHAWYGIAALEKMYGLTADESLRELINNEVAATLNPELYYLDLEELWPGVPPEEGMPIMIADFARHRGSFFYPVLTSYAEINDDPAAADLALLTLYCWGIEGRGTNQIQSIVASSPLRAVPKDQPEDELIQRAADLLWRAAANRALNSDFSQSAEYWHHWRPFPGKSLSHHTNWQRQRQRMATLDSEVKKVGERSLRLNLSTEAFRNSISVDNNRFRLEPGQYQLSGWVRWDEGGEPPRVRIQSRDLAGSHKHVEIQLHKQGAPSVSSTDDIRLSNVQLSPPDAEGWRHLTADLDVVSRHVVNFSINAELAKKAKAGHVWLDDFNITAK